MTHTTQTFTNMLAALLIALACCVGMASADTITWNVAGGGDWDTTTTNWTGDLGGRNDNLYVDGDDVTFDNTAGGVINLTADRAPGSTIVSAASGTYTFSGSNVTSGSLTKSGAGTLVLNNTFSGSNIALSGGGGIIQLGASDRISDTATVSGSGVTIDMNNFDETLKWASGSYSFSNMGDLTITSSGTADRTGGTMSGSGSLTFGPGHSTTVLRTALNYTGGTFINDGFFSLYGNTPLSQMPVGGDVTVASGATFGLNWHNTAGITKTIGALFGDGSVISSNANTADTTFRVGEGGGSSTFGGVFSGAGSLVKIGTGTLTLDGNNTYTGPTTVSGGALIVNGVTGPSQGNYTVEAGATLGGSGTINLDVGNSVTVDDGGILIPGQSAGTLTINGGLVLNADSLLEFELGAPGVVGSGVSDLIEVGNLTLDGTLNINALPGFGSGTYRLINYSGSLTDNGLVITGGPTGTYQIDLSTPGEVNLLASNVVPEPSTLALLALGMAGLVARQRRNRS